MPILENFLQLLSGSSAQPCHPGQSRAAAADPGPSLRR